MTAAFAVLGGCGSSVDCNSNYVYPTYRVTVTDGATGAPICDADVTVDSSGSTPVDCHYTHKIPTGVASATVAASKAGYAPTSKDVSTKYDQDECNHAIAVPVKLVLKPL